MTEMVQNNQVGVTNTTDDKKNPQKGNGKIHQHLSTIFIGVGIVSFVLGAVVNFYTIQRIRNGK